MLEMYPAMVNSVATSITGSIGATDTTIHVLDEARIPEPPNLLVLGEATAQAETVKLTAKNGSALTVVRGFQGAARAWSAGTTIARNFTAYDHDAFKANVEENAENLANHKTAQLPHVTGDGAFDYGFRVDENGILVFMYEERAVTKK
jgi:hypothetical protein